MLMSNLSLYVNDKGKCVMHYSGFSWLAGIVLVVWALQRRLYLVAAFSLIYGIAYNVLLIQLSMGLQVALWLIQLAVFGSVANRFHRWLLERGGWLRTDEERPAPQPEGK